MQLGKGRFVSSDVTRARVIAVFKFFLKSKEKISTKALLECR